MEVTGGFLLLMAWLNYCDTQQLLPAALCAAAIHELGHCAAVWAVKGRITLLRLSAVGAELRLEGTLSYGQELICALAGPVANLATAIPAAWTGWEVFAGINLSLCALNLLPVSALDGGRIVSCISAMLFGPEAGGRLCSGLEHLLVTTVLLSGALLFLAGGSITLLLVAVWLLGKMLFID